MYYVTCPFIEFHKRCWHVKFKTSSGFMVIYVVNMCIHSFYVYFRMVQEKDTKSENCNMKLLIREKE